MMSSAGALGSTGAGTCFSLESVEEELARLGYDHTSEAALFMKFLKVITIVIDSSYTTDLHLLHWVQQQVALQQS